MQSCENAPEPATVSDAAAASEAPDPAAVSDAAAAAVASEPAVVSEAAVAADAPQQEAEAPAVAVDSYGSSKSPSRAASPSMEKERQIPVDPASLRRLGMVTDEDSPLSAPSVLTEVVVQSPLLPPLRRPTFVGASLPCSAVSSPVAGAGARREEAATASPTAALRSLARQHSAALARLVAAPAVAQPALSRCASRAEGRTMAPHDDEPIDPHALVAEDGFTCGALCMLIPGFSRRKPTAAGVATLNLRRQPSGVRPRRSSASRVASLERFECGSWRPPPPVVVAAHGAADCLAAVEVAKTSCADDADAPVKMAFVFDGEAPTRGILKKSASASRQDSARPSTSSSSQRHVRFSTAAAVSCPSSPSAAGAITPRLARARAEFTAYLEAQSA